MYVVITERVVQVGTGATKAYEPRKTNRITTHVSGPFSTHRGAQAAVRAVLTVHTCLSARILSAAQVAAQQERIGYLASHERDTVAACVLALASADDPDSGIDLAEAQRMADMPSGPA